MSLVRIRSQEDVLEDDKTPGAPPSLSANRWKQKILKLGVSFFLFGLINNVLYVIILSAALDLVPPSTPKGIIAFCNIFPALIAKLGWPYFLKGKIRYTRRIVGCALLSFIGMLVVALYESLFARLLGISLASFSSGLGELTFLQLSTTYNLYLGGHSVGYFASGTGAAGLVGAFMWWEVRGLGVRLGVGVSSVGRPFVYVLVIPILIRLFFLFVRYCHLSCRWHTFSCSHVRLRLWIHPLLGHTLPLPEEDPDIAAVEVAEGDTLLGQPPKVPVFLTAGDKWCLVKPMILKYMLPLFLVYTFEYTINQGVAPTLLYPVPSPDRDSFLSKIIHSIRDYYPLWQLVYQSTVFVSRSSISLGIPPLPENLLSFRRLPSLLLLLKRFLRGGIGIVIVLRIWTQWLELGHGFRIRSTNVTPAVCLRRLCVRVVARVDAADEVSVYGAFDWKPEEENSSFGFGSVEASTIAVYLSYWFQIQCCTRQIAVHISFFIIRRRR
ncbi:hypothetical protein J3R82DRAFT_7994, partial [Butyriboletus roseoflavus]